MNGEARGGSRLFHAIVTMGAAFGAACGGSTASTSSSDAASDATSSGTGGDAGANGADALADVFRSNAGGDAGATGTRDSAADAPEGNVCGPPLGSDAGACIAPYCCKAGVCFPCFV
jgi:hypothetical protein